MTEISVCVCGIWQLASGSNIPATLDTSTTIIYLCRFAGGPVPGLVPGFKRIRFMGVLLSLMIVCGHVCIYDAVRRVQIVRNALAKFVKPLGTCVNIWVHFLSGGVYKSDSTPMDIGALLRSDHISPNQKCQVCDPHNWILMSGLICWNCGSKGHHESEAFSSIIRNLRQDMVVVITRNTLMVMVD